MRWLLQPTRPRAHDRRCSSEADRGNDQSTRLSRVVVMDGLLCGESRSGPDPLKLGWYGVRKEGHATGYGVWTGASSLRQSTSTGFKAIRGCARGSNWSQISAAAPGEASRKRRNAGYAGEGRHAGPSRRAAFDEAASGGGPGTFAVGGESNPINPRAGARQSVSEAGARPCTPG
jgi:hypothetical protein